MCILQFRHFCTFKLIKAKQLVRQQQYPVETLSGTAEHHREGFPTLILLATLAIIQPVHTADCERAFSPQNVITTSLRNRINSHHCNEQMKIMIMGAPFTEFQCGIGQIACCKTKSYFPKVAMTY